MPAAPTALATPPSDPVRWMHSCGLDVVLMFCWMPLAVIGAIAARNPRAIEMTAGAVLLLSLAHQPITMAMVYGEPQQFRQRRRLFVVAPLVLAGAIYVGLTISFVLVALVGAAWNTEHTLMQRYGIVRIYRRKGGDGGPGRYDFHLLMSWLAATLAWVAADPRTSERIESLGLQPINRRSAEVLVDVRPVAWVLVAAAGAYALWATSRWLRREAASGFSANRAVYLYTGGTLALFITAVINPVAGFVAWVGSHAIEYFVIVVTSLRARYPRDAGDHRRSPLERAVQSRLRSLGVVVAFTAVVLSAVEASSLVLPPVAFGVVFFLVGGLHILYDGFIWKLGQPQVARSFALDG